MNLIKAGFEILEPSVDYLSDIEKIARTCYKSEDKIKEGSAKEFVEKVLISKNHLAMCEHGTIYMKVPEKKREVVDFYSNNKYSVCIPILLADLKYYCFITTNYRVILDNNRQEDLQYQIPYHYYCERRISVKFTTDRGVSHEFVRNRGKNGNAFGQESTRYCNYLKKKFGMSVTFIQPEWVTEEELPEFKADLETIEAIYFKWLNKGWIAQQARGFLPNFTKTELWVTGTVTDWGHFFYLRSAKDAHPQARELSIPLQEEFIKRGYIMPEDIRY